MWLEIEFPYEYCEHQTGKRGTREGGFRHHNVFGRLEWEIPEYSAVDAPVSFIYSGDRWSSTYRVLNGQACYDTDLNALDLPTIFTGYSAQTPLLMPQRLMGISHPTRQQRTDERTPPAPYRSDSTMTHNRDRILAQVTADLARLALVDGRLWRTVPPPVWVVHRPGLSPERNYENKAPTVELDFVGRDEDIFGTAALHDCVFHLDETEDAIRRCKELNPRGTANRKLRVEILPACPDLSAISIRRCGHHLVHLSTLSEPQDRLKDMADAFMGRKKPDPIIRPELVEPVRAFLAKSESDSDTATLLPLLRSIQAAFGASINLRELSGREDVAKALVLADRIAARAELRIKAGRIVSTGAQLSEPDDEALSTLSP